MKEWALNFWNAHGERTVFISAVLIMCLVMWQVESLQSDAKTAITMVLGILVNKIRSPKEDADK